MEFEIRFCNENEVSEIAKLSKTFEEENICNGIVADDAEYFKDKEIAVALKNDKIVGYCYGTIETEKNNRSYAKEGDKLYYLEEIYILKEFRNKKVGEMLFNFVEKFAKENNCKTIRTNAVSKDYNSLLNFYINKMDMNFHSAFLIKPL